MISPNFTGEMQSMAFCHKIEAAYKEVNKWKRNVFHVPTGKAGTMVVSELSRILGEYGSKSPIEKIARSVAMTIPHLLLQKPHAKSKQGIMSLVSKGGLTCGGMGTLRT